MPRFSSLFCLLVAGAALAHPTNTNWPTTPACTNIALPIKASAENTIYPAYPNSKAPGTYLKYIGKTSESNQTHTVSGTYEISATYCEPSVKVEGRESTVQLLLHALANTKEYFSGSDFPNPTFEGEYSWVSHATAQGYATLAIDRLGNGQSAHPDPVQVVQAPLEIAITMEIIAGLKSGSLPHISNKYSKIVLGAHSYGAILAQTIAALFPTTAADGYVLTGDSYNLTGLNRAIVDFQAFSANVDQRYAKLPNGYLSISKTGLRETSYGLPGTFDPRMLAWDQSQPHIFAIGEIAGNSEKMVSNFTGPVLAVVGQNDAIACGNGNILSEVPHCGVGPGSSADTTHALFPKTSNFGTYSPAGTAHFLDNQYSASETLGAIHAWLADVGF